MSGRKRIIYRRISLLVFSGCLAQNTLGQPVISYKGPRAELSQRWPWGLKEASQQGFSRGFWLMYSIQRLMDENSFITTGMFFSASADNRFNLYDLVLDGKEDTIQFQGQSRNKGLSMINRGRRTPFKVMKDVAILVEYSEAQALTIESINMCNMELNHNFKKKPVLWLGPAEDEESVIFLEGLFAQLNDSDLKENAVNAVGAHQQSRRAFTFLKGILTGDEAPKVRSQAAFWMGNQPRPEALNVLVEVAQSGAPKEVKEQTVFAISQIESEEALDQLITLARKGRDSEMRRKATFWLGQRVSRKAMNALEDMVAEDEDTEVQRQALFALSNIPGGGGVERLISVAKNHPKARIRKQAIMSLGQIDDPRAREALIEIARSN
ncbi:MAG: HEAT repeat domain-containing protein [Ignavibacteriales bacterium]|nr:HEAT repeat domain-containing protein [Ignavibacteriales bacterium]